MTHESLESHRDIWVTHESHRDIWRLSHILWLRRQMSDIPKHRETRANTAHSSVTWRIGMRDMTHVNVSCDSCEKVVCQCQMRDRSAWDMRAASTWVTGQDDRRSKGVRQNSKPNNFHSIEAASQTTCTLLREQGSETRHTTIEGVRQDTPYRKQAKQFPLHWGSMTLPNMTCLMTCLKTCVPWHAWQDFEWLDMSEKTDRRASKSHNAVQSVFVYQPWCLKEKERERESVRESRRIHSQPPASLPILLPERKKDRERVRESKSVCVCVRE